MLLSALRMNAEHADRERDAYHDEPNLPVCVIVLSCQQSTDVPSGWDVVRAVMRFGCGAGSCVSSGGLD